MKLDNCIRVGGVVLAIALISPKVTLAASFDCSTAATRTEKTICAEPGLSALDEVLALQWSSMSENFPKSNQTNWLTRRDKCESTHCIQRAIEGRVVFLKEVSELIGDNNRLTCEVGQTVYTVRSDKNGLYILAITDEYFNRIDAEWNAQGSGVCRTFEYYGYDGQTKISIMEAGRCLPGELPYEEDLLAHIEVGPFYFKCTALTE